MTSTKSIILTFLFALGLAFTGCSQTKKRTVNDPNIAGADQDNRELTLELNADSDSGKAGAIRTVYFAFNSAALSSSARDRLESNARYLKDNPNIEVQIEGHCDERGGVQYNLALGERRAQSVKNYLAALGVSRGRMTTISFGKERPIAFGHSEDAWSKNRRANFVVTAK